MYFGYDRIFGNNVPYSKVAGASMGPTWVLSAPCWPMSLAIWGILLTFVVVHDVSLLWPSDAIWRHKFGPALAQIMTCCTKISQPSTTKISLQFSQFSHSYLSGTNESNSNAYSLDVLGVILSRFTCVSTDCLLNVILSSYFRKHNILSYNGLALKTPEAVIQGNDNPFPRSAYTSPSHDVL